MKNVRLISGMVITIFVALLMIVRTDARSELESATVAHMEFILATNIVSPIALKRYVDDYMKSWLNNRKGELPEDNILPGYSEQDKAQIVQARYYNELNHAKSLRFNISEAEEFAEIFYKYNEIRSRYEVDCSFAGFSEVKYLLEAGIISSSVLSSFLKNINVKYAKYMIEQCAAGMENAIQESKLLDNSGGVKEWINLIWGSYQNEVLNQESTLPIWRLDDELEKRFFEQLAKGYLRSMVREYKTRTGLSFKTNVCDALEANETLVDISKTIQGIIEEHWNNLGEQFIPTPLTELYTLGKSCSAWKL